MRTTSIVEELETLPSTLEARRRQLGDAAWQESLAEAREREVTVLAVRESLKKGESFACAVRSTDARTTRSTVRRWMERYEALGLLGLINIRGQVPHGHPDPVLKPPVSRTRKPRSFIKWAGSKAGVLKRIIPCLPNEYRTYYEPMVGSGVLFFALNPTRAVLADINEEIVTTYRVLRDDLPELLDILQQHENTSEHYFAVRALDPYDLPPVERAARFIYLNKTCFNGMYRVNSKGRFNVPYGRLGHANICDTHTLSWASEMLRGVELRVGSFRESTLDAGPGDLVYLDPPYLEAKARRTQPHLYQPEAFGRAGHEDLATFARELVERGCHVLLSNADVPDVHELYAGFDIRIIQVRRPINRNANARDGHREVLILGGPNRSVAASPREHGL